MLTKHLTLPDSVSLFFLGDKGQYDFNGEDGIEAHWCEQSYGHPRRNLGRWERGTMKGLVNSPWLGCLEKSSEERRV